jgi:hypothetical protein
MLLSFPKIMKKGAASPSKTLGSPYILSNVTYQNGFVPSD